MVKKAKTIWTSLNKIISISQRELVLSTIACTMTGIVLGMLISPRKNVTIGSHNASHNTLPQTPESAEENTENV